MTKRRTIDPVARIVLLVIGLAGTAAGIVLRYLPSAITAENGLVRFRLFSVGGQAGPVIPVWLLWLVALGLLALMTALSSTGRQAVAGIAAGRRTRRSTVTAILLLVLTLLPAIYSHTSTSDQSVITYLALSSVGILGLLLAIGPVLDAPARLLLRLYNWLMGLKPLVLVAGAALVVFLAASMVSWRVLGHVPRIHDDVAQLFQARLFAHGRLFAVSPPVPQFFDMMLMINDGRWYSQYPPGHPLMLMLGVLVGAPWLINPLLGALTVVAAYLLGREIYDERTARLGTLLLAFSPYFVLTSGQFINHSSSLFFAMLFLLCYFRSLRSPQKTGESGRAAWPAVFGLLAGLALGMVVLVRPYTGLLIAVPFALDALYRLVRAPGRNFGRFALMALGALVMVGLLMGYNYLTSGNALELGYVTRYGAGHGLGFNKSGWGQVYTLAKAFVATGLDLNAVNRWFFEFPVPALLFVAILFAARRARRYDFLLLGVFAALVAGYFFYWWHALLSGPRWEYESLPVLALLMARGVRTTPDYVRETLGLNAEPARTRQGMGRLLVLCYLSVFAVAVPCLIRDLPGTLGTQTSTLRTVRAAGLTQALVVTPRMGDVFLANQVPPGGNIVFAKDLGPLNPLLVQAYPGRKLYYASLDTLREFPVETYEQSELKPGIDSCVAELMRADLRAYRSLFIPADELSSEFQPVARRAGLKIVSYRTLDRISVGKKNVEGISFPAIAAWVFGDRSEHVVVFQDMERGSTFISGALKFTYIGVSANGLVALYDVRPVR
jgi:4-amino-4-deoxy-L-arabinose transferase-like glycosyltransferase